MEFTLCWSEKCVRYPKDEISENETDLLASPVADMLLAILSICSQEELVEADSDSDGDAGADVKSTPEEIQQRRQQIKNKILAVGRMQRVFQLLRSVLASLFFLNVELTASYDLG